MAVSTLDIANGYCEVFPSAVSVSNDTMTKIAELKIPEDGCYIIDRGIQWEGNSTGERTLHKTGSGSDRINLVVIGASPSSASYTKFVAIEKHTKDEYVYAYGKQTSGNSLNAYGYIRAVRVV